VSLSPSKKGPGGVFGLKQLDRVEWKTACLLNYLVLHKIAGPIVWARGYHFLVSGDQPFGQGLSFFEEG
jgi:hypothetical protein